MRQSALAVAIVAVLATAGSGFAAGKKADAPKDGVASDQAVTVFIDVQPLNRRKGATAPGVAASS